MYWTYRTTSLKQLHGKLMSLASNWVFLGPRMGFRSALSALSRGWSPWQVWLGTIGSVLFISFLVSYAWRFHVNTTSHSFNCSVLVFLTVSSSTISQPCETIFNEPQPALACTLPDLQSVGRRFAVGVLGARTNPRTPTSRADGERGASNIWFVSVCLICVRSIKDGQEIYNC